MTARSFRSSEVAAITGLTVDQIRDLRRTGRLSDTDGNWSRYSIQEVALLLFVKTLREEGLQLDKAWSLADDEIAAAIVFEAVSQVPTAIIDNTASKILKTHPTYYIQAAMDLTGLDRGSARWFIWGAGVEPNTYASLQHALEFNDLESNPPAVLHQLDLAVLAAQLVRRAVTLGSIEDGD